MTLWESVVTRLRGTAVSVKLKGVIMMLRRAAHQAEERALTAEQNLEVTKADLEETMAIVKRQQHEMKKLKSLYMAMQRYAESLEEERDEAQEELVVALERTLKAQAAAVAGASKPFGREVQDVDTQGPLAPGDMTLEELRAECDCRGLSAEGPLAALRLRVRASRARDRGAPGAAEVLVAESMHA